MESIERSRKSEGTRTGERQERARWELVCPESLTTRSLDSVRAQRMLQSDFQTLA